MPIRRAPLVALAAVVLAACAGDAAPTAAVPTPPGAGPVPSAAATHLALLRAASVRNRNHDASPYREVRMADVPIDPLLGPRSDYVNAVTVSGNPEPDFPVTGVGTFRIACEFSHFAYDDPLLYPGQPGAAHLHMFFGNTDVNAYTTWESLRDRGSSTCNGQELNRTGYWAPAIIDAQGNARVPERIIVYYKGYGLGQGGSAPFPDRAAMITKSGAGDVHLTSWNNGGTNGPGTGEFTFQCTDQFRGQRSPMSNTIPTCTPGAFRRVLEMHVKFPMCWNGQDPADWNNWGLPTVGGWFFNECSGRTRIPHIEYIIAYPLEAGETTAGWYLSSDVDAATRRLAREPGSTSHADWWGAWKPEINRRWLAECVNFRDAQPHGCGFGYLTNGGPDGDRPLPGPALRYRPEYTGPIKVAATTLHRELCPGVAPATTAEAAAYCRPPRPSGMTGAGHAGHLH